MGCDIHLFVEEQTGEIDEDYGLPKWRHVEKPDAVRKFPGKKKDCLLGQEWLDVYDDERWYGGRNYELFALLANVRNGVGFAGIRTGDWVQPILPENASELVGEESMGAAETYARGVPRTASDFYKARVMDMGSDGHSHSWLTLAELKGHNWSSQSQHVGVLDLDEYVAWKETGGVPTSFCSEVYGPNVVTKEAAHIDEMFSAGAITKDPAGRFVAGDGKSYFVRVHWNAEARENVQHFLNKTLADMEKYAALRGLKDDALRIVFFFDN